MLISKNMSAGVSEEADKKAAAAAAINRRRDYGACPQGKPMTKREERLLSESGRLLTLPSTDQQLSRGTGGYGWTADDSDSRDGAAEQQQLRMAQLNEMQQHRWEEAAVQCSDGQHPVEMHAEGCPAEPWIQQPRHLSPMAHQVTGSGSADICKSKPPANVSQQAQPRSDQPGSADGLASVSIPRNPLDVQIASCTEQKMQTSTSEAQEPVAECNSGVKVLTELQRLQQMFAGNASSAHIPPAKGQPLTQEQADLALAAMLQEEEVRLHTKSLLPPSGGRVLKKKAVRLNTLDTFLKRTPPQS